MEGQEAESSFRTPQHVNTNRGQAPPASRSTRRAPTSSYDRGPDVSAAVQGTWLQLQEARSAGGLTPSQQQYNRPDQRQVVQDQLQRLDIRLQQQGAGLRQGHHGREQHHVQHEETDRIERAQGVHAPQQQQGHGYGQPIQHRQHVQHQQQAHDGLQQRAAVDQQHEQHEARQHEHHDQHHRLQHPQQPPPTTRYAAMLLESGSIDVQALQVQAEAANGLLLYTMKRQKRKDAWHFVRLVRSDENNHIDRNDLDNEHAKLAYCLLCNTRMTFRVGKSRVPQHVETYHPVELQRYVAEVERSGGEPVTRNLEDAFSSAADEDHPKQLRTITSEQQRRVNELLAEWISRHFRPLVIVEDEGFVRVIRYITEDICGIKLSLPERTKIRQEIVRLAVIYRRRVHNAIEIGCLFYSLTSDIWTARNAISYISVTIHYVDDDFRPQSWTLEVRELPGIHESHVIALAIEEILEDWSLPKHNCVMFLRDGGSNMVAAGELLGVKHMACIAHCLHLIVGGAMLKKKKREDSTVEPPWAAAVAAEGCSAVPEREEEVALSQEDRNQIEGFREIAIDDMEAYLDETIAALQRNEMDSVRSVVQRFRSLSVYFRKSAKEQSVGCTSKRTTKCQSARG